MPIINYNDLIQDASEIWDGLADELKFMSLFYKINDINTTQMKFQKNCSNPYKNPAEKDWCKYIDKEQDLGYVISKDWNNSVGIGAILGWKGLRALDVDGIYIPDFFEGDNLPTHQPGVGYCCLLEDFLKILGLPIDYEWITLSGSGKGFHILFRCDDIGESFDTISFAPSDRCLNKETLEPFFDRIELRWRDHLVLPPSLHKSGNRYKFRYDKIPTSPILLTEFDAIDTLLSKYCGIRSLNYYTLSDGTELEMTTLQKCISRTGSNHTFPDDFRADSLEWIRASNTPEARNTLAVKYLSGEGLPRDIGKAIELFQESYTESSKYNLRNLFQSNFFRLLPEKIELKKIKLGIIEEDIRKSNVLDNVSQIARSINDYPLNNIPKPYYLFFDTETTGVPNDYNAPASDIDNWPRLVQIGWILSEENGNVINTGNYIIQPSGYAIPKEASNVHGITTERAMKEGVPIELAINLFLESAKSAKVIVGHNISFDQHVVGAELYRLHIDDIISQRESICTMRSSTEYCQIPGYYGYKWPKLQELHGKLFGFEFDDAHDAMADIAATKKCFFEMKKRHII